ncbi:phosphatidylinositol 4-kinase gamma 4-like [Macadamia integrifolia]|uniref:phosphatidylinositol 4-kinase gamma 4-like n=1 Tax=Macadamia integrifolia TaxID=60698 RepID=UPI001C52BB66|nr:phosphatidylinositol 4-kinase gamma 4-like [Macadamia integrifolia]
MSTADVDLSPIPKESLLPGYFDGQSGSCSSESIMIFLTVSGSVIPLRVLESDSIASVKLRIQSCKGFVVKKQKLVFGGRELARNDSLVRDYGVTDGNVLHLVLRLSDLRVITVKTACGKDLEFHVERSRSIAYIKQQIAKKGKGFVDLKDQELICDGEELEDQWLIDDICKNSDAVIHLLVRKSAKVRPKPIEKEFELSIVASDSNEGKEFDEQEVDGKNHWNNESKDLRVVTKESPSRDFILQPIIVNPKIELSSVVNDLINSTFDGLDSGNQPVRSSEGSGGAYFMPDSSGQKYVAVFKPMDEEPMAVNNPRGLPLSTDGEGLKRGTIVGEGAFREVAVYILDHPRSGPRSLSGEERGFAGVPPTVMVRCLHGEFNHPDGYQFAAKNVKIGSLQMFMKNIGSCEDMGPRAFPVEEVHKISVLDMRLANADRHAGNILVGKEGDRTVLIPIDHGYCLPENFEDCTFDWLYWPQAREPYTPETIEYIRSLDAEQDIALLKFHGWSISRECARIFRTSTMLLKKGVEKGLTPFAIGRMMCRETLNKESVIEKIIHEAMDTVLPGMSEAAFLESVSQIMDRHIHSLTL